MIVGLPFAGLGMAQIYSGFAERDHIEPVLIIVGLGLTLIGLLAAFLYRGIIINRQQGVIVVWYGLLFPMYKASTSLADYNAVKIVKRVTSSDGKRHTSYPISLVGSGVIECDKLDTYQRGLAQAEKLAKFLEFGLHDSTSGEDVFREEGTLDESIGERAERMGEQHDWPALPEGSAIRYETRGQETRIDLPVRSSHLGVYLALFIFYIVVGPIVEELQGSSAIISSIRLGVILIAAALFATHFNPAWRQFAWGESLGVSPNRLRITRRSMFIPRTITMAADEIEELNAITIFDKMGAKLSEVLPPHQLDRARMIIRLCGSLGFFRGWSGVRARSDRKTCIFGATLPDEEIHWLHGAVQSVLVGQ
jgi:hypothetical protein